MTNAIYQDGVTANIYALRHTLAKAVADANTAWQDLENGNVRAAVGAVLPIRATLDDSKAALETILLLNRLMD